MHDLTRLGEGSDYCALRVCERRTPGNQIWGRGGVNLCSHHQTEPRAY